MIDPIQIIVRRYSRKTGEKVEEERIQMERHGCSDSEIRQVVDTLNVWAKQSTFGHREEYAVAV